MRPYLIANCIVSQCFFELIKAADKYLLHWFTLTGSTEHNIWMEERQNIVMHAIILAKVEIETVPKYLRTRIGKKVLRNKNDQCILFLPPRAR